jgi:starch synthase
MKDKRILFVSSEVVPYLPETELSLTAFNAAKNAHSKGVQTRIFMPRYGVINERRHQLHEVIRLSGMNLVVNDMDMPLIIKVASIPKERMQVYFIDNEEYFKRKAVFTDEDDQLFDDNDERAIFFAKGVVETVKKLTLNEGLADKVTFDLKSNDKIATIKTPNHTNILKSAIENSDAIIHGSEDISEELSSFIEEKKIPVLGFQEENFKESYLNFYTDLVSVN